MQEPLCDDKANRAPDKPKMKVRIATDDGVWLSSFQLGDLRRHDKPVNGQMPMPAPIGPTNNEKIERLKTMSKGSGRLTSWDWTILAPMLRTDS